MYKHEVLIDDSLAASSNLNDTLYLYFVVKSIHSISTIYQDTTNKIVPSNKTKLKCSTEITRQIFH